MTIRHGVSTVSTEKSGEVVAESSGENEIRDRTGLAMGANHCGGYAGVSRRERVLLSVQTFNVHCPAPFTTVL